MQGDLLLQEWKQAKETCRKVIQISKRMHLGVGDVEGRILAPGQKQTNRQFINVYDVVYRLCLTREKEENRVVMVYRDYKELLKTGLLQMLPVLQQQKEVYKLGALRKVWDAYCEMQRRLNNMFAYLNRPYHLKNDKIEDLDRTSTNIVAATLFSEQSVAEYQILYFSELQRMRRSGDLSNAKMLAGLVDIFYHIHSKILKHVSNKKARTLFTDLYNQYQRRSKDYYHKQFKLLSQSSPADYFSQVSILHQAEREMAQQCFVITSDTLISREFAEELIGNYKPILLSSQRGLKHILREGQHDTLRLIVELNLKLTRSLDGFKEQFEEFIFEEMRSYIQQNKAQLALKRSQTLYASFMEKLLRKNDELTHTLQAVSLVGDFVPYFKTGIEKAFIASKPAVPIEQLLAVYVDFEFRKEATEDSFENMVKSIITVFNCCQNKDLFLLKYSHRFARRLLVISETVLRNHEIFISNLKINCGIKYTEMLETIVTQSKISQEQQPKLSQIVEGRGLRIGLTLKIFSEAAWPSQTVLELPIELLPAELRQGYVCIQQFRALELNKKTLKISALESKVRWIYFFETQEGRLEGNNLKEGDRKSESCYFDTNSLQAVLIFYLYRQRPEKASIKFLIQLLPKVSPKLVQESLLKMSQPTESVLIREGKGDEAFFSFNPCLRTSKKLLQFDQGTSQEQQRLFQNHDLGKDRELVLDANISKLMKAKKVLDLRSIIEETAKMIRVFVPLPKDIKMAVERLIAKQLLQRDEKDREIIRYKD